jgi:unsaturated rhamnogalacturonyl hydrolase
MNLIRTICLLSAAMVLLICPATPAAADGDTAAADTAHWPDKCQPADVGRRIAANLLTRKPTTRAVGYPEVCTAYGSLRLAAEIKDKDLLDKIVARYAPMLTAEGKHFIARPRNVDSSVFGVVPLELYKQTEDDRYLAIGKTSADAQWQTPRDDGLTTQTRFWIDDMFMITGLQTQAFRATHDKTYLDRAAAEMVAYIDKLQQPSGLFHHSTGPGEFCWGRGNGWMAVGMAELLSELPTDHPQREKILASYRSFMSALVKVQTSDGMWRQVLDDDKSWIETSCSGMFVFALGRGVTNGWLDKDTATYEAAARRGWIALCGYVDDDANVKEVCIGTNRGKEESYYLERKRAVGDLHGQAATVWAAWSMLKLDERQQQKKRAQ